MKDFKELVTLLGKNALPLDDTKLGQRAYDLYRYVRRVAEPTDDGGARKLQLEKGSSAFRKVKHKLKYALLDGITAVPRKPSKVQDRPSAAINCWRTIALAKSTPQAYELLSQDLIDHQIAQTKDYDLLEASSQLTDILADRPSVGPEIVHYLERSDYLGALGFYMAELQDASFHVLQLRADQADFKKIELAAKSTLDRVLSLKDQFEYIQWHYHIYVLEINFFLAKNDYQKVLEISERAVEFFDSRGDVKVLNIYKESFKIYQLSSYSQLCCFNKGEEVALSLLENQSYSRRNYFKVKELLILMCLRTGNIQKAYYYFKELNLQKPNHVIEPYFAETNLLFEAFIHFYISLQVLKIETEEVYFKKFRTRKFLNSFEYASKEKSSRNILVVIIRALFDVVNSKRDNTYIELDYLEKYMRRYLQNKKSHRSRLFIRSLILINKEGATGKSIQRGYSKYISKLSLYSFVEINQDSFIEIVPFELLWDELTELLIR